MRNQIGSELRKLTTTRSVLTMLAALLTIVTLGVIATVTDYDLSNLMRPLERQPFLLVPLTIVPLFALLLGIRSFTDEFRHGSIVPTLLADPNRGHVLGAKLAATAVGGAAFAAVAIGTAIAVAIPLLMIRGVELTGSVGPLVAFGGRLMGVAMLWTTIGVGLGLAVRHQVAAIAGALIWMLAGEQILSIFLPGIARYFPGSAGASLIGINAPNLLAPWVAAAVLAGWAVVATVAGGTLMRRRDVV
jgi:ABC-2 type transport system permease protein